MSTLNEFKKEWATDAPRSLGELRVAPAELLAITQARSARHVNHAMHYFWASLTNQIIVYGLLSHVFIRCWGERTVQGLCLAGVLLYLPFTVVLLRQFKRMARPVSARPVAGFSPQARIQQQYDSLRAFYRFKRGYEYLLIPLSTALGVWLLFRLYVPGGVVHHPTGAAVTYLLALLACGWAIWRENRTRFEQPMRQLKELLEEFQ